MMAHVELLELKMIGGVRQVVVYNVDKRVDKARNRTEAEYKAEKK